MDRGSCNYGVLVGLHGSWGVHLNECFLFLNFEWVFILHVQNMHMRHMSSFAHAVSWSLKLLCESKFTSRVLVIVCKVQALAQYWRNISTGLERLLACRRKDACEGGLKRDKLVSLLKPVRQRKLEFGCQVILKNEC